MSDSELIEQMARQIFVVNKPRAWDEYPEEIHEYWRDYARAALDAILAEFRLVPRGESDCGGRHDFRAILEAGAKRWERGAPAEPAVTDKMADAAHLAYHDYVVGPTAEPLRARDLGVQRQAWLVAVRAALEEQGKP